MNKAYYKHLSAKYFDAMLTERENRRLIRFLSRTEDPDFDEVKAVAGFFATGRSLQKKEQPARRYSYFNPWTYASTALAAVSAIICVTLLIGNARKEYRATSLASMESTLTSIFSSGTDVESELSNLMTFKR